MASLAESEGAAGERAAGRVCGGERNVRVLWQTKKIGTWLAATADHFR
jgi:hypothetical protein